MMKFTILVAFMLVGVLCALQTTCKSCGNECEQACGTRRFRGCCFNYLRKKRGPDTEEFWAPRVEEQQKKEGKLSVLFLEYPDDLDAFGFPVTVSDDFIGSPEGNLKKQALHE